MKIFVWLNLLVVAFVLVARAGAKLESGSIYYIGLLGGRSCPDDEGYLGFYNRTCGALSPKSVGPAVRSASAQTWRQWQVDIVDETATEQWGYLTTYYPEDWGEARCVGSIVTLSSTCSDSNSRVATINALDSPALFRFVPLEGQSDVYRIILKDRTSSKCNRFLSSSPDCSMTSVGFVRSDLGKGLQRWVITKVDSGSPTPTETPTPYMPIPYPSPPPTTKPPVQAPTITAAYGTSLSSANVTIASPDASAVECTATLNPGGRSETVSMPDFPGMMTVTLKKLSAATSFKATASCRLSNGEDTPMSEPVSLRTLGGFFNTPPPGTNNVCDGRGEIVSEEGRCVCDAYDVINGPFKANGNGGCTCFEEAEDLGYGPCQCPPFNENCLQGCCPSSPPPSSPPPTPTPQPCEPKNFTLSEGNDYFGQSVALNTAGDILVVGDYDGGNDEVGEVHIYQFNGSDWTREAVLAPENPDLYQEFGIDVDINSAGDAIVVGDHYAFNEYGQVNLYEKSGSSWNLSHVFRPTAKTIDTFPYDDFGYSVAVNAHGNVSVISDRRQNSYDSKSDAGAVHVFVFNGSQWNFVQTIDLGDDALEDAEFGRSVDINGLGDVIVVGHPMYGGTGNGKAFVYRSNGSAWELEQELVGSNTATDGSVFGFSVAINAGGDVLVVGDWVADYGTRNEIGLAYVFRYSSGTWTEEQILEPEGDGQDWYQRFGSSVDINGDGTVIAVGDVDGDPPNNNGKGMAYIFRYSSGSWTREPITPTQPRWDFGHSVALNDAGDVLVVSDVQFSGSTFDEGVAYIYRYSGGSWSVEATLDPSLIGQDGPAPTEHFGIDVDINAAGDVVVVGDYTGVSDDGRAYVFRQSGGSWSLSQTVDASDDYQLGRLLGWSVSLDASGDVLLVGDPDADLYEDESSGTGKVFAFRYNTSAFVEEQVIFPPLNAIDADEFGRSVAINGQGNIVVVGDPDTDYQRIRNSGLVYVFELQGSSWVDHILWPGNDMVDYAAFGSSVAINSAGDVVAAGAPDAHVQADDYLEEGKVYIFRKTAGSWTFEDALTATDFTEDFDFGRSVALNAAGDVLVVGDGRATSGAVELAGQAYVFRYSGGTWVEEQILSAGSEVLRGARFGYKVDINDAGDLIAVGSYDADVSDGEEEGKVYLFGYDGSTWTQVQTLNLPAGTSGDFGRAVAMDGSGDTIAVGDNDEYSVHVFDLCLGK